MKALWVLLVGSVFVRSRKGCSVDLEGGGCDTKVVGVQMITTLMMEQRQ
jgi:hypothetical protein